MVRLRWVLAPLLAVLSLVATAKATANAVLATPVRN